MSHHNLPLGEIITTEQERDAIHIAVIPVVAGEWLAPAGKVRMAASGKAVVAASRDEAVGIVDPFLKEHVTAGQRFYLFMYPNTITSLRHNWTHPSFPNAPALPVVANGSEKWLRDFADSVDLTYNQVMTAADDWVAHEEYLSMGGHLEGHYVPEEFWPHYENVRGVTVVPVKQRNFFTCSC